MLFLGVDEELFTETSSESAAVLDQEAIDQPGLVAFLESAAVPQHSMNFYQLDGYLRAIACAPSAVRPLKDWFPLIFNDLEPVYKSCEEELKIRGNIASLYAFHCHQVANNLCNLPCDAVYASLREERTELEQWARGYLQGYIVSECSWNDSLARASTSQADYNLDARPFFDELDAILYIVSTVADAEYALEQGASTADLKEVFERLPKSMILCGYIGRILYDHDVALGSVTKAHVAPEQLIPELVSKVGLTSGGGKQLCSCGSGKLFNTCCLH